MLDLIRKVFLAGLGAMFLTKSKAEEVAEELVKRGELKREEVKSFIEQLLEKGREQQAQLQDALTKEFNRLRHEWGLATKADLAALEARIKHLEEKLLKKEEQEL